MIGSTRFILTKHIPELPFVLLVFYSGFGGERLLDVQVGKFGVKRVHSESI